MERLLDRLGRAAAGHPWRTIAAWALAAVAVLTAGQALGGAFNNDFRVPGVDSQRAADLARDHFPAFGSASADIVWHVKSGTLRDPAVAAAVAGMVTEVRRQPDVTEATDPLLPPGTPGAGGTVSVDGRTALATVRYGPEAGELTRAAYDRLAAAAAPLRARGVAVDFRGLVVDMAFQPATGRSELIGLGIAALVLLLAFGSLVAAGLPIVIALVGLVVGTAGVLLVAAFADIPTSAPIIAVMLGIGTGVDYALFVVTRFRRALADGETPVAAAGAALATSGHAVLYAGAPGVVAILGLTFAGIPFLGAMGVAAALVVAVMVVAALTLLPALLGLLGHRVNLLRPLARRAATPATAGPATSGVAAGGWDRWCTHLGRHRLGYAIGATALLVALAAPLLSLRLGTPDDGNQPLAWPQRRAYDTVAHAFGPGWNAPLLIAVAGPAGRDAGPAAGRLRDRLAADRDVAVATPPVPSADGRVTLLTVVPRHAPQDAEVTALVHRIRRTVAPAALAGTGAAAYVGGQTGFMIDMADTVAGRLPWVVFGVVLAATLLLIAMFRAPLVALKAALLTLLSIGAAYGVLVAVFQWGWGLSLLGVDQPVPTMSIVPMFLFAVLFGLSMDYEVFLLSAIREAYAGGADAGGAVVTGLARTGRVITAAAAIMASVFVAFAAIDDTLVRMIGVGLAAAVIIDATIIRVVLAPALLGLVGRWAWWPGHRPRTAPEPPRPAPALVG